MIEFVKFQNKNYQMMNMSGCGLNFKSVKGDFEGYDSKVTIGKANIIFNKYEEDDDGKMIEREDFVPSDDFFEKFSVWYEKIKKNEHHNFNLKVTLDDQNISVYFTDIVDFAIEKTRSDLDTDEMIEKILNRSAKFAKQIKLMDDIEVYAQEEVADIRIDGIW